MRESHHSHWPDWDCEPLPCLFQRLVMEESGAPPLQGPVGVWKAHVKQRAPQLIEGLRDRGPNLPPAQARPTWRRTRWSERSDTGPGRSSPSRRPSMCWASSGSSIC